MSFDLQAVCDEIAGRLQTVIIPGGTGTLRARGYMPDSPNVPEAGVAPMPGDFLNYDPTVGEDAADIQLVVTLAVGAAVDRVGQSLLYGFLAPSSVPAALNGSDYTSCEYVRVVAARNFGMLEWPAGTPYFGVQWVLEVKTS